jgi:hypothetical protein
VEKAWLGGHVNKLSCRNTPSKALILNIMGNRQGKKYCPIGSNDFDIF